MVYTFSVQWDPSQALCSSSLWCSKGSSSSSPWTCGWQVRIWGGIHPWFLSTQKATLVFGQMSWVLGSYLTARIWSHTCSSSYLRFLQGSSWYSQTAGPPEWDLQGCSHSHQAEIVSKMVVWDVQPKEGGDVRMLWLRTILFSLLFFTLTQNSILYLNICCP